MLKHSKQRDAIEQFLATRYDHPTAETVYLNLREDYPKISPATVYRNLSLLAELGNIQKIPTGNGRTASTADRNLTTIFCVMNAAA